MNRGGRVKIYVCDLWDGLCDLGEHYYDNRCYKSIEDAEKRAERMTYTDGDYIEHYATVDELEACWEPEDAERLLAQRNASQSAYLNERQENAKLRKTLKALMTGTNVELCSGRDAPQCRECSMHHDGHGCAMTDAMRLLGCDHYGEPMEVE